MNPATVIVSLLILAVALMFVGWPLGHPELAGAGPSAKQRRRGALREEKERLLSSLGDLDHDHQTGKMDDADYEKISSRLKSDTARVLREIDVNEGRRVLRPDDVDPSPAAPPAPITPTSSGSSTVSTPANAPAKVSAPIVPAPSVASAPFASQAAGAMVRFCTKCGWKAKAVDDAFCGKCGAGLPTD